MKYFASYSGIAVNQSTTAMAAALAVQPHDLSSEALLGVTIVSDTTTTSAPNTFTRSIEWQDDGSGPFAPGQPTASALQSAYIASWSRPLGTPLTSPPITFHE
jgi:hypothetical protein